MKYFENKEMKPFKDLSDEEKLFIIEMKQKGDVEAFDKGNNEWSSAARNSVWLNEIYCVLPRKKKPFTFNWDNVNSKYIAAGYDKTGVWLFDSTSIAMGEGVIYTTGNTLDCLDMEDFFDSEYLETMEYGISIRPQN